MKSLHTALIACAIAAITGTACADSGSLVEFKPQVMPVVVQVNAQGRVTDILPPTRLSPRLHRLLVQQLDAWITKPVTVKGHPVASSFIAEVAVRATPRKDGKYNASFVYVKSMPMPFGGAVHWNNINGGLELALVSDDATPSPTNRILFDTSSPPQPRRFNGSQRPQPASGGARPAFERAVRTSTYSHTPMPAMLRPAVSPSAPAVSRPSGAPRTERP